jgi:hypothetical protein
MPFAILTDFQNRFWNIKKLKGPLKRWKDYSEDSLTAIRYSERIPKQILKYNQNKKEIWEGLPTCSEDS